MIEDQTAIITKQTSNLPDSPQPQDSSNFKGLTGRCWIAIIFSIGFNLAIILTLIALILGNMPEGTSLTAFLTLMTLFSNLVSGLVGIYMGQFMKNKPQT